jgi:hypothetical protein
MKEIKQLGIAFILSLFILVACKKTDDTSVNSIVGTYVGTYSAESGTKSISVVQASNEAIAEITNIGNGQIQVYCYGSEIDTTFTLNYFEHNDSILVCLSGNDFENRYGHMYGSGHMSGGMMSDMQNGETEWAHHMNDEHIARDEHFGGFDMIHNTFNYTFELNDGDYHFQGIKN